MAVSEEERSAFSGGVAVITGAGAGIGEGLARYAATQLDMTVVLADIDAAAIEKVSRELNGLGARAVAVSTDVRDATSVDRLAARTYDQFGDVRLLVNNAGVEQFGYLWDTPVQNWNRLVEININGVFHGIRSFVPCMLDRGDGPASHVLNLSSVGGVGAAALQAPYIMSKHAVLSITECLYLEILAVGANVRVAAVLPGIVTSNIFQSARSVDHGDVDAAEDHRQSMLTIREKGISALAAAETIFQQAAAGEFYIVTQPEMVLAAMANRGD
ncbi:MAG TPA: SDR family NAD(P)-dependent oxidoreductase, partial [Acidimicrobiales bacterium]|nr:SDR family NAD(P)-dependent oxidoreductase [Acidimicrobiales bacterium]